MNYVTVEDIKKYLYIDFDDDDAIIGDMINAAEGIITKRLGVDDLTGYEDERDELPAALIACIKIMTANLYNSRESVAFNATPQKIPYSLEYLLQPFKNYKKAGVQYGSDSTCCDDTDDYKYWDSEESGDTSGNTCDCGCNKGDDFGKF